METLSVNEYWSLSQNSSVRGLVQKRFQNKGHHSIHQVVHSSCVRARVVRTEEPFVKPSKAGLVMASATSTNIIYKITCTIYILVSAFSSYFGIIYDNFQQFFQLRHWLQIIAQIAKYPFSLIKMAKHNARKIWSSKLWVLGTCKNSIKYKTRLLTRRREYNMDAICKDI